MFENDEELIKHSIEVVQKSLGTKDDDLKIEILSKDKLKIDYSGMDEDYSTILTRDDVHNFSIDFDNSATLGEIEGDAFELGYIQRSCFEVFQMLDKEISKEKEEKSI